MRSLFYAAPPLPPACVGLRDRDLGFEQGLVFECQECQGLVFGLAFQVSGTRCLDSLFKCQGLIFGLDF